jgi:hypothetical protein
MDGHGVKGPAGSCHAKVNRRRKGSEGTCVASVLFLKVWLSQNNEGIRMRIHGCRRPIAWTIDLGEAMLAISNHMSLQSHSAPVLGNIFLWPQSE